MLGIFYNQILGLLQINLDYISTINLFYTAIKKQLIFIKKYLNSLVSIFTLVMTGIESID